MFFFWPHGHVGLSKLLPAEGSEVLLPLETEPFLYAAEYQDLRQGAAFFAWFGGKVPRVGRVYETYIVRQLAFFF